MSKGEMVVKLSFLGPPCLDQESTTDFAAVKIPGVLKDGLDSQAPLRICCHIPIRRHTRTAKAPSHCNRRTFITKTMLAVGRTTKGLNSAHKELPASEEKSQCQYPYLVNNSDRGSGLSLSYPPFSTGGFPRSTQGFQLRFSCQVVNDSHSSVQTRAAVPGRRISLWTSTQHIL